VVTEKSVQDLPLNGRNLTSLVQITAGVNAGPPDAISSGNRPDDRRPTSTFSANGKGLGDGIRGFRAAMKEQENQLMASKRDETEETGKN
jgi:hypothetical protein